MIVDKGRELILKYLSGRSQTWAGAIELGIGSTAVLQTDENLEFPYVRVPVEYGDYDAGTNEVILRAVIPNGVAGEFHEVGVFSDEDFPEAEQGNTLIAAFNDIDTTYTSDVGVTDTANVRAGTLGYLLSSAGFVRALLPTLGSELSGYTATDEFVLAYNLTAGTPSVSLRFESTSTDYYEHTFTGSAGYNIEAVEKQNMTQTGTPSWGTVTSVYVSTNTADGIMFDALAVRDSVSIDTYGMVARQVLGTPVVKSSGVETEVTFTVGLSY